ncbi:hypothetical protein [Streptomyces sp. NBC_01171]|uniref:hypothetical protein n=1 Tax=Streptomyces sp. NBC_01171 TaxID=2903757 RepID=UPI003869FF41|nr:hypothetical protein OG448_13570 [Streptomyces sp. NBC_01171]
MTTAKVRAAAAAGLVGALALTVTACGGDGSPDDSPSTSSAAPAPSGSDGSGGAGASDRLQGSWITTGGGKIVALVITGKQAGLFVTGGTVCSGTAGEQAGQGVIRLTCQGGDDSRAEGTVDSVSGKALKVTWKGSAGSESYTRAEGGKLPTGLPTSLQPS